MMYLILCFLPADGTNVLPVKIEEEVENATKDRFRRFMIYLVLINAKQIF